MLTQRQQRAHAHELERRLASVQFFAPGAGVADEGAGVAEQQSTPIVSKRMTWREAVRGGAAKAEGCGRSLSLTDDDFAADEIGNLQGREGGGWFIVALGL